MKVLLLKIFFCAGGEGSTEASLGTRKIGLFLFESVCNRIPNSWFRVDI